VSTVPAIDHAADRAVYKQLADLIRAQIQSGEFRPGQRLPAQKDYMQEHYLARHTVDRAMIVLRGEGLIVTDRGGSYVRDQLDQEAVHVEQGEISARMPTAPERRRHDIKEGVPMLVVTRDGQEDEIHPADRVVIQVGTRTARLCTCGAATETIGAISSPARGEKRSAWSTPVGPHRASPGWSPKLWATLDLRHGKPPSYAADHARLGSGVSSAAPRGR
jgi:DNA-binding transcriptional regulator YhcF (GntR family)